MAEAAQKFERAGNVQVLILMNEQASFGEIGKYLEGHGFVLRVAHRYSEAIQIMETFPPLVILLSWNLKGTDVKRAYTLLTEKLGLLCLVFTEDSSAKTSLTLMNSGIHNHILPPISGRSLQLKIDSLLKKETKDPRKLSSKDDLIIIHPDQLPGNLEWEIFNTKKIVIGEHSIWRASGKSKNGRGEKNYYFRGPEKPQYNEALQKWTGFEKSPSPILMQERPKETEFSATQEGLEGKLLECFQKATPVMDFETALAEMKGNTGEVEEAATPDSVLAQAVAESLKAFDDGQFASMGEITRLQGIAISSARFSGYLLFANSQNGPLALFKDLAKLILEKMKEKGEALRLDSDLYEFEIRTPLSVVQFEKQAEFIRTASQNGNQISVGYIPEVPLPRLIESHTKEATENSLLAVDLRKNILAGCEILFDLHLDLKKNHKIIHYLNPGTVLDEKTYEKLLKFGIAEVYIKAGDRNLFFAYCARNRILRR